jgi:hypothetical protein
MRYLTGLLIARKSASCVLGEKVNEGSILRRNLAERQYLLGKFSPRPTTPQFSIVSAPLGRTRYLDLTEFCKLTENFKAYNANACHADRASDRKDTILTAQ